MKYSGCRNAQEQEKARELEGEKTPAFQGTTVSRVFPSLLQTASKAVYFSYVHIMYIAIHTPYKYPQQRSGAVSVHTITGGIVGCHRKCLIILPMLFSRQTAFRIQLLACCLKRHIFSGMSKVDLVEGRILTQMASHRTGNS